MELHQSQWDLHVELQRTLHLSEVSRAFFGDKLKSMFLRRLLPEPSSLRANGSQGACFQGQVAQ